ncbi:hypothetical protein TW86_03760 [Halomonas sp. S2151]|uniref:hypothetical protein n=1 Tax=Halomonas sp. S2151 TaxID=579478 RepID=UPI0005F9C1DC|nr:hypothetical protein [Halomonas sp. S2151]KJZ17382.1 hypothetical protein TW86_03760 [Halomonas sp. S2151]
MKCKSLHIGRLPSDVGACYSLAFQTLLKVLYLIPISLLYATFSAVRMIRERPLVNHPAAIALEAATFGLFCAALSVMVVIIQAFADAFKGRLAHASIRETSGK